jgi:hypothetical protein
MVGVVVDGHAAGPLLSCLCLLTRLGHAGLGTGLELADLNTRLDMNSWPVSHQSQAATSLKQSANILGMHDDMGRTLQEHSNNKKCYAETRSIHVILKETVPYAHPT